MASPEVPIFIYIHGGATSKILAEPEIHNLFGIIPWDVERRMVGYKQEFLRKFKQKFNYVSKLMQLNNFLNLINISYYFKLIEMSKNN